MTVLGIESSCDDCCVALVRDGRHVIAERQHSQAEAHAPFGGVVPEVAARAHTRTILPLFLRLLAESGCKREDIDGVAVTETPGLHNSLMVGRSFAYAFAHALGLPCAGVNHLYAHLYAAHIAGCVGYPHIGVIVSGGHTLLGIVRAYNAYDIVGETVDDACGEAFDKVGAHLGLEYPGGAQVERLAERGDARAARLPQSQLNNARSFDLSYSGLKTAVIHQLKQFWNPAYPPTPEHIAAAFQDSALAMIVKRVERLIIETGISTVVCGGGVCANRVLAARLRAIPRATVHIPPPQLCTDNATMIAAIGFHHLTDSAHDVRA